MRYLIHIFELLTYDTYLRTYYNSIFFVTNIKSNINF